jgi:hypothetical protein
LVERRANGAFVQHHTAGTAHAPMNALAMFSNGRFSFYHLSARTYPVWPSGIATDGNESFFGAAQSRYIVSATVVPSRQTTSDR